MNGEADQRANRRPSGLARTSFAGAAPRLLAAALLSLAGPVGCADTEGRPNAPARTPSADTALERLAREVRPVVEEAAGLSFRHPPRLARASREELEAFLSRELSEELPPERARALTEAYARFGLLDDTLDLRGLLRSLYLEQVVGYYDPGADTLFVREGVSPAAVEPVLVHELVHALQDQHMDLDSVMEARAVANDAGAAARAALEGHATFVMLEWQLEQATGRRVDLTQLPDLGAMIGGQDVGSLSGMPALAGAPELIQQSLLFPYTGGLAFLQQLWKMSVDRPVPIGDDLPASTEQILHPGRFAGPERDRPTGLRFTVPPGGTWREVHTDGLGEFETRFFLATFLADSARARAGAEGWDGDRYRLLRREDGAEALVWVSVWDRDHDAEEFAGEVREAYAARYGDRAARVVEVRRLRRDGRPYVLVTDLPAGVALPEGAWSFGAVGGEGR